jgi:nucleoside 2-deoxyribosyltransferase
MKKVYIGTSLLNAERARQVKKRLESLGIEITYDWTTHGQVHEEEELAKIGLMEKQGVAEADLFLMIFPSRTGSHFEMGLAYGLNIPIVLLMETEQELKSFYYLPGIRRTKTEDAAIGAITEILGI